MLIVSLAVAVMVDHAIMSKKDIAKALFDKKKVDWIWRVGFRFFVLGAAMLAGIAVSVAPWYVLANGFMGVQPYPPVACFGIDNPADDFVRLGLLSSFVFVAFSLYVMAYNGVESSMSLMMGFDRKRK